MEEPAGGGDMELTAAGCRRRKNTYKCLNQHVPETELADVCLSVMATV